MIVLTSAPEIPGGSRITPDLNSPHHTKFIEDGTVDGQSHGTFKASSGSVHESAAPSRTTSSGRNSRLMKRVDPTDLFRGNKLNRKVSVSSTGTVHRTPGLEDNRPIPVPVLPNSAETPTSTNPRVHLPEAIRTPYGRRPVIPFSELSSLWQSQYRRVQPEGIVISMQVSLFRPHTDAELRT